MSSPVCNNPSIASTVVNASPEVKEPELTLSPIFNLPSSDPEIKDLDPSVKFEIMDQKKTGDSDSSLITTSKKVGLLIGALFATGFTCFWFILEVPVVAAIGLGCLGGGLFIACGYYIGTEMNKRKQTKTSQETPQNI